MWIKKGNIAFDTCTLPTHSRNMYIPTMLYSSESNHMQHNTCFLLNLVTRFFSQCVTVMDVTIDNHKYWLYAHLFSWNWSTFNNINFGKTWSFFRRCIIDVFFILKGTICYQKSQKCPNITDKIMYLSMTGFSVFQSSDMCCKVPWEGDFLLCFQHFKTCQHPCLFFLW